MCQLCSSLVKAIYIKRIVCSTAQIIQALLVTQCGATDVLSWRLTTSVQDQCCRCFGVIHLERLQCSPNGWRRLPHEVQEAIVPALTLVVSAHAIGQRGLTDVPLAPGPKIA